jgi:hypothetical protein
LTGTLVRPPKNGISVDAPQLRGRQVDQMDGQCVAGLGTLDQQRPGLRVEVPRVQRRGRDVISGGDPSAVGVLGPQRQDRPGLIRITGSAPPNVYRYWSGVGMKVT